MNRVNMCLCFLYSLVKKHHQNVLMISFSPFIPFHKKYASLPELFSRDAVLDELGVLPEDIQGVKITSSSRVYGFVYFLSTWSFQVNQSEC